MGGEVSKRKVKSENEMEAADSKNILQWNPTREAAVLNAQNFATIYFLRPLNDVNVKGLETIPLLHFFYIYFSSYPVLVCQRILKLE